LQQGKYIVALVDNYAGGMPLVVSCLVEVILVSWVGRFHKWIAVVDSEIHIKVYGVRRLMGDIRLMLGVAPNTFWRLLGYPVNPFWYTCWVVISPLLLMVNSK
jgi:hypothetical protein